MRTVRMKLDEDLVEAMDRAAKRLGTTREAFVREALRKAVEDIETASLEQKHRRGYELHPVGRDEFSVWEGEHDWGDE